MLAILHQTKIWTRELPGISKITVDRQRLHTTVEQIKTSTNNCFSSVKLTVVLKSNVLFLPNLKDSVTSLQRSYLIYRFTCKCDVCYINRTNQCLEISIKQQNPSRIRTHISDYTTSPSSYNSTSAIDAIY